MPKKRGNGEGSVVKYKDGYRAIIVTGWRDRTHPIKHTKSGFATIKEARDYIALFNKNEVVQPSRSLTISKALSLYADNGLTKLSSSKQTHYKTVAKRIEVINDVEMSSLTLAQLQELVKGYTYYPARDIKSLLSHLYKIAIADGVCSINLSQYIVLPKLEEEETVPFTADEVAKMWDDYKEHPTTGIALLMCGTGMMPSEIVNAKKDNLQGQFFVGVGSKTNKRKSASVPVPNNLIPVVEDLFARGKADGLLPYKFDTYRKEFKEMVKRIGADPRCTPYSCRHTFATLLSTQVPAHVLAKLMRNDIRVTQKYYLHEDNEMLLSEVNRVLG